jgi:hypothetical protein
VLGAAPGKAAENLLGLSGTQAEGGRVLHHLVVLLLDQLPANGARQRLVQLRVLRLIIGPVELDRADVFQPRQEAEAEQVAEPKADYRGTMAVGVVRLHLGLGAVTEQPLGR